jgi:hypothetical protein
MATYQVNANQGTLSGTAKGTMALWTVTTLRRLKIYEFDIGAVGAPTTTDCQFVIDLSRITGTSSVTGASYTPNPTDPADGAAAGVSLVNITAEILPANVLTGTPEYHNGINMRNTVRWVAAQESQYFISPATALNGHYMSIFSTAGTYTAGVYTNVYYLE